MTHNPQSPSPLFTQVDITAAAPVSPARGVQPGDEQVGLLRNILSAQDGTVLAPGHGPLTTVKEEKENNPFFPEFRQAGVEDI